MGRQCPSCNKLAGLETQDPEVENLEVEAVVDEDDGSTVFTVTANVRLVRVSACCGDEMKEANFDLEGTLTLDKDEMPEGANPNDATVEESSIDTIEEGGGRYKKSFHGVAIVAKVHLGDVELGEVTLTDKIAASAMDELT